jgi:hypothetical protein
MATTFFNFREDLLVSLFRRNHVADDAILYDPLEKVELRNGGGYSIKLYPLGTTKWVEEFLRVPIEARLVRNMNSKHLPVRTHICHVLIL